MNTILADVKQLFDANHRSVDDSEQLRELADCWPFGRPALIFVADAAGGVEITHAAEAVDARLARPAALAVRDALAADDSCRFSKSLRGLGSRESWLFGLRLAGASAEFLGGLTWEASPTLEEIQQAAPLLRVCGRLALSAGRALRENKKLHTQIEHHLAEEDTLKAAHTEALVTAIEEQEKRLLEEHERSAAEQACAATEAANRAKSQFLANMSHEIREPILHGTHPREILTNPKIAIVDDQPINIAVVQKYLKIAGFKQFATTTDARQAMEMISREWPDVVLLDIMMPYVSGLDILNDLRRDNRFSDLPVIILTAASERQTKLDALKLGATEFLHKPFDAVELEMRLRNVLALKAHQDHLKNYAWELELEVAVRSAELVDAHREVVRCLARVGEFRDNDTGKHVLRVGKYAAIVARCLGLSLELVERIGEAAALHDIGKVAIADAILLKPGKLDEKEFTTMKDHCEYGRRVCSREMTDDTRFVSHATAGHALFDSSQCPVLAMAAVIAYTHHERWDGTGYPQGLSGEQIPLEGRITAVADVFDALTNARPYKPPVPLEASLEIIRAQGGTQFDPRVVDAFFSGLGQIIGVYHEHHEDAQQNGHCPIPPTAVATAAAAPPPTTAGESPR